MQRCCHNVKNKQTNKTEERSGGCHGAALWKVNCQPSLRLVFAKQLRYWADTAWKKKTEHRTHIFRQGAWKLCFAQTSSRGAGLKELKVDVSGSQWHASAGTILTPLNLSDPSVPALSLPRCGSSKISLLQGASNYEGVNEAQRKVFCFSFSCRVKKKQKKIYILLHLTFKSQHSAGKKQQHWNLIRWTLLTYLLFNEPEKFKYNACMVLLQKWD